MASIDLFSFNIHEFADPDQTAQSGMASRHLRRRRDLRCELDDLIVSDGWRNRAETGLQRWNMLATYCHSKNPHERCTRIRCSLEWLQANLSERGIDVVASPGMSNIPVRAPC